MIYDNKYKFSKYNIEAVHGDEGRTYLFNSYSGKGRWIDGHDLDDIKDKRGIDLGDVPEELAEDGFIVPETADEYGSLMKEIHEINRKSDTLYFIIATTKACNYRCYYCFEGSHISNENMDPGTMEAVSAFIIGKCKENPGLKSLVLQWFGGEPLLFTEPIRRITQSLAEYVQANKIELRGHITTNGRLLTPELVDEMADLYHIKTVQITLDGTASEYERIKGCSEDDFLRVIDNIRYAQDRMKVFIRLNLKDNLESLKELIAYLYDMKLKVHVRISHIFDLSQNPEEYLASYREYTEEHRELADFIREEGYLKLFGDISKIPKRRLVCKANASWHYAIDIYGNLFRCVEKITDPAYSVGNVYEGITEQQLDRLFLENPLYDRCRECAYLPMCLGKCTMERLIENKGVDCETVKRYIKENIKRTVAGK